MNTSQIFGKRIKIERIMRDWTMEQLPEKADLGMTPIASVEKGVSSPTLDTIEKLAKALGFKIHELLIFDDMEKFTKIVKNDLWGDCFGGYFKPGREPKSLNDLINIVEPIGMSNFHLTRMVFAN